MNTLSVQPAGPVGLAGLKPLFVEVEEIIARHHERGDGFRTPVPGLQVGRILQPVPPSVHMAEACVCVVIRGSRSFTVGDDKVTQNEQAYLLSTVGLPSIVAIPDACPTSPYTALRIDLDLDLAREVMAAIDEKAADLALPVSPLVLGRMEPEFMDAVLRLVRLIETPRDIPFLSGLLHREILYRLLLGPAGGRFRQLLRLGAKGTRAAAAVAWLRDHFREPLKVGRLADVAGMAVSTLHRHFHALVGMSPIQYQKRLRLHEARRLLLEGGLDVGSTALNVGYESSTQFIREYRRLFGEPPLRDVKALRAQGGVHRVL